MLFKNCEELMKVTRHIDKVLNAQSLEEVQKNRLRLKASIASVRWLSLQACAFRGHDEAPTSSNRGNFIEMANAGRGINQIGNLHRSGSTRWSSHFDSICSLIDMYGATISVLGSIVEEGNSTSLRGEATERSFLAMELVKTALRNKMEEEFLADSMMLYIERDLVEDIDSDSIIDEFYSIKNRRLQLK
ncbi:hypothetical protein POM88_032845 [Heracleum sosnowskyi]|uniref:DUF4371 domain-containing protein n=1 Tax=Heracleum sosnowskyi TaxID=360622 RepID=A0AAD8ML03_9APIA|nr:hypothetical protein POM88_032845 [Heracleum sosnowskyi]